MRRCFSFGPFRKLADRQHWFGAAQFGDRRVGNRRTANVELFQQGEVAEYNHSVVRDAGLRKLPVGAPATNLSPSVDR